MMYKVFKRYYNGRYLTCSSLIFFMKVHAINLQEVYPYVFNMRVRIARILTRYYLKQTE